MPSQPTGASNALLVSLAILKTNWNEDRASYIDNFVPFVTSVMAEAGHPSYSALDLQEGLRAQYGIHAPQPAINTILTRAARSGLGSQSDGRLYPHSGKLAKLDLRATRAQLGRQREALVSRLKAFAHDHHNVDLADDEAADYLARFIDEHSIALLRAGLRGDVGAPPLPLGASAGYVVASFVVDAYSRDPETFEFLDALVKGSMLTAVLYLPTPAEATARVTRSTFFLDTPVLLTALGYNGTEGRLAAHEALSAAYAAGASLAAFDITVSETRGVLRAAGTALRRVRRQPAVPSRVEGYLLQAGYTAADVEIIVEGVEEDLQALHVRVIDTPARVNRITTNEEELEATLTEHVRYLNPAALRHDLNCLVAVHTLRDGEVQPRLETSKALFVTSNTALIRASRAFFNEIEAQGGWPLALRDDDIGTLMWLKNPMRAPDLPRLQILADSYAALEPRSELWAKYLEEIERLAEANSISDSQVVTLRYSLAARQALMRSAAEDPDALSPEVVKTILKRVETEARAPTVAALAETRNRSAAEISSLRERVVRAEGRSHRAESDLTAYMDRRRANARRRSTRLSLAAAVAAYVFLGMIVVFGLILAVPGLVDVSVLTPPLRWGVTIVAIAAAAITLVHMFTERSPLALARAVRVWVEPMLLRRFVGDLNNPGSPES